MDVDFWGVVNGTKAFLPHLIASGDGHVVNISSLFGLISMPGQSAYNSAKFAVRGFTESLREEMLAGKRPVKVTCVHPGGIKTAVARNATVNNGDDAQALADFFDQQARPALPRDGGRHDPARRRQGPPARADRLGGQGPRPARPRHRFGLPASRRPGLASGRRSAPVTEAGNVTSHQISKPRKGY